MKQEVQGTTYRFRRKDFTANLYCYIIEDVNSPTQYHAWPRYDQAHGHTWVLAHPQLAASLLLDSRGTHTQALTVALEKYIEEK